MSDDSAPVVGGLILGIIITSVVWYIVLQCYFAQAVANGAAHYEVNAESGATKWMWDGARPKPEAKQ